ncbi:hypothetical protein DV736_g3027, partial [Chaetothyriales sp. CBS 134916]
MRQRLPHSLAYPITITKYAKQAGDRVRRGDSLFLYSYLGKVKQGNRYDDEEVEVEEKFVQSFTCDFEGQIEGYFIWEGQTIDQPVEVCDIIEDCKHEIIFSGICANCGQEVSGEDQIGRAPINITHDASSLTISKDEASRVDEDNKKRLLATRKLSLVVDLDQTIIHAAVDPTIGEWMKEPENPNHGAVKDVEAFQLMDDGPGMRGCCYYIKQRPGLQEFLTQVSELYELHIYTMGTRQYAKKVAEIIDKKGEFFKDRILSRDESGSMTAKSLSRLFPIDTKMVVIIDDRADVWDYSLNLVRVKAFDFFQGIGDINSSFLPKQEEILETPHHDTAMVEQLPDPTPGPDTQTNGEHTTNGASEKEDSPDKDEADASAMEKLIAISAPDTAEARELQCKGQEKMISSQIEEKPLEKKQREQDEKDEAEAAASAAPSVNGEPTATQSTDSDSDSSDSSESSRPRHRHAILKNDDDELIYLEDCLRKVHAAFFKEYDRKRLSSKGGRVAKLSGGQKAPLPDAGDETSPELRLVPEIKRIMPAMKQRVLAGVVMVYSGVLPLGHDVFRHDMSRWASSFGAKISEKVTEGVTHVIAARPGTAKVNKARKMPHVKIVTTAWLFDSMQQWRRLDESKYYLEGVGKRKHSLNENGDASSSADFISPDFLLSDSEDDTSGFDTDDGRPNKRPRLDLAPRNDDDVEPDIDEYSPTSIADIDWASADAEVAEFLGSDAESGSDTESVVSSLSYREKRTKKRRDDEDAAGSGEREDEEDRGAGGSLFGSKQQPRSSYLSVVSSVGNGSSKTSGLSSEDEKAGAKTLTNREQQRRQLTAAEDMVDSDDELLREFAQGLD